MSDKKTGIPLQSLLFPHSPHFKTSKFYCNILPIFIVLHAKKPWYYKNNSSSFSNTRDLKVLRSILFDTVICRIRKIKIPIFSLVITVIIFSITVITRIPGVRGWKIPVLFLHYLFFWKWHIIMCWSTNLEWIQTVGKWDALAAGNWNTVKNVIHFR